MCIAIAKPMGVKLPSKKILKTCWNNNPDGAGFAFTNNNAVTIHKGFMDFKDFYKDLMQCSKLYDLTNAGMLIHFRIATHGGVNGAMTHPFPIHTDEGALSKPVFTSNYAVVHNGIISLTASYVSKKTGLSDTALFIKDYLTNIASNKRWFTNPCNIDLIEKLIESKMAILRWDGKIINTSGFHDSNGVLYSNTSYQNEWGWNNIYSGYWKEYDNKYDTYPLTSCDISKIKDDETGLMTIFPNETVCSDEGYISVSATDNYYADRDANIYISDDNYTFYLAFTNAVITDASGFQRAFEIDKIVKNSQLYIV